MYKMANTLELKDIFQMLSLNYFLVGTYFQQPFTLKSFLHQMLKM